MNRQILFEDLSDNDKEGVEKARRKLAKWKEQTLCWKCNHPFGKYVPTCPKCGATNANVDSSQAMFEQGEGL